MQIYFVFAADYVGIGRKDASKWTALTESALRIGRSVISPFQNTKTLAHFCILREEGKQGNYEL